MLVAILLVICSLEKYQSRLSFAQWHRLLAAMGVTEFKNMIDVMNELRSVADYFKSGDFSTGLERLADLWAEIPEPKTATGNAYLIIEYGVAFALKAGNLDEAQKWAAQASVFADHRHDMGEVEFLVGKVAFERGEHDIAKENFRTANQKSEGRLFEGADLKYKALLK